MSRPFAPTPLLNSTIEALYAPFRSVDFFRWYLVALIAAVGSFCAPVTVFAHDTSLAYLDLSLDGRAVHIEARLHGDDLGAPVGRSPLDRPTRAVALERYQRVAQYVADRLTLTQDHRRCPLEAVEAGSVQDARDAAFRLVVRLRMLCPRVIDELTIRDDLFFDIDDNHRAFAKVRAFGALHEKVFAVYDRTLVVRGSPSSAAVFRQYVTLGVEHIATGYDHLAFLLALLAALAARGARAGLRPALAVVTSFTLAHSVTLALAALGLVRPSSRVVESTIALSIAVVAALDVRRALAREQPQPASTIARMAMGFGFGLVHGLGFAGALGELGLPRRALVRSLAAFNIGVELGQLTIAAIGFPLLGWLADKCASAPRRYDRRVLGPLSVALVALGLYWFVARIAAGASAEVR